MAEPFSLLGGSLLGAGGQIAGGVIGSSGGLSSGDLTQSTFNPTFDAALQASQFDALNQIGFGNINNTATPFDRLIQEIQGLSIDNRTKRRALRSLNQLKNEKQERNPGRLTQVLRELGMTRDDVQGVLDQQALFKQQQDDLAAAGLGGLQQQTVLDRARTGQTAAELAAGAADFARTGSATNPLQQNLLARDDRRLADLQDRLGVLGNFGNLNVNQLGESLIDAKLDQNIRLIEEQLGIAGGLSASLQPGLVGSQAAAGQSTGTTFNAAQIAAQQAAARNSLLNANSQDRAGSLASGIAGAAGSLGSGLANFGAAGGFGSFGGGPSLADGGSNAAARNQDRASGQGNFTGFGGGSRDTFR